MRLLIVDDTEEYIAVMQAFLKPYGNTDSAINGLTALEKFEKALEEKNPYKIIFLDITMPDIDGREVTRCIREKEAKLNIDHEDRVRILLVSARTDTETVLGSMLEDGGDGYLIKPITREKLKDAIDGQLNKSKEPLEEPEF